MASEAETKLQKQLDGLTAQLNAARVDIRKLHRLITHPSTRTYIQKYGVLKTELGDLLGIANRVVVTNGLDCLAKKENVTLSTPQDIHSGATPTFAGLIPLTDADNLGTILKRWDVFGFDITVYNILDWSANPSRPKIYSQLLEPDIPDNTIAIWEDTTSGKNYTLVDIAGTQYKVELNATGIIDHGGLSGLSDDDHTQYLNNARHDITTRHPSNVIGTTWADYSAISTIVGWSSFTTKEIYYKKIGNLVFVIFAIRGTSDSTAISFTLPYSTAANPTYVSGISARAMDNSVWLTTPVLVYLGASSNIAYMYRDFGGSTGWTNTNLKRVEGQFFYEAT